MSNFTKKFTKRLFDISLSSIGILLTSPISLATAISIKLDSKGPIFYSQERTGKNRETFKIYKFRSMTPSTGECKNCHNKSEQDRITKIGRFIRKYRIDEIPQLFNIVKGDMSLVGPRATNKKYGKYYSDKSFTVRPGLFGLSTLKTFKKISRKLAKAKNPEKKYISKYIAKRDKIARFYADNYNLLMDMKIISLTMKEVFLRGHKLKLSKSTKQAIKKITSKEKIMSNKRAYIATQKRYAQTSNSYRIRQDSSSNKDRSRAS